MLQGSLARMINLILSLVAFHTLEIILKIAYRIM